MTKRVSMKDIAVKVGVSIALVSYVLNGLEKEKRVSMEMAKKVRTAAKELRYQPNQIARSLRKGTTNTIGLIVADIANPFFGQLARIIEDEAAKFDFTVIFGSSNENCSKFSSLIDSFINRQVDGLIITPSEGCSKHVKWLLKSNIPLVLMDRFFPDISTNHVVLDNYAATYSAVNCLVSNGRYKIKLIAYKSALVHNQERIKGYRKAMEDNGLSEEILVHEVMLDHVQTDVDRVIANIADTRNTNALIFATNTLSISGLYSIRKHNLKVPDDLAVIGFDGHEVFDFFQPQISYIKQPLEEMAKESVRILFDQMNGKNEPVHLEITHQLIERDSSG